MPDEVPIPDPSQDPKLTPFSTSTTDPSGQTRTLTGYGTRRPIKPPGGMGGIGMPDLGPGIAAAYRELPVDEAAKAVEAAIRYQGQRGYMRDLASGKSSAEAFAKWAPMMFRTATGLPEAINRTSPAPPPQITPQQQVQNALNQRKFELSQREAEFKMKQPKSKKVASITVPLNPENSDGAKITGPADDPDIMAAVKKHEEAFKPKAKAPPPPPDTSLLGRVKNFLSPAPEAIAPNPAMTTPAPVGPTPVPQGKVLTKDIAKTFLEHADGNKEKARKLARDAGYQF